MILVSGGFDPLHIGHLRMIQSAAQYGPVVVAVNSDPWLIRKKGFVFMPWAERAEILRGLRDVSSVEPVDDLDGTVCEALERLKPKIFANGGDRMTPNPRERAVCEKFGITQLFGIGGGKAQSSSELVKRARL